MAQGCVDKIPPNHSMFSHTVRNRTYTFLIEDPFSYFTISNDRLLKSDCLSFLHHIKTESLAFVASHPDLVLGKTSPLCFQDHFSHLFQENVVLYSRRNPRIGYNVGGPVIEVKSSPVMPTDDVLVKKKKKRLFGGGGGCTEGRGNADGDLYGNNSEGYDHGKGALRREASILMVQNGRGGFYLGDGKQKAKQSWKKHVWVVLGLDLMVCAVLFGVWLWICQGVKCMAG